MTTDEHELFESNKPPSYTCKVIVRTIREYEVNLSNVAYEEAIDKAKKLIATTQDSDHYLRRTYVQSDIVDYNETNIK